MESLVSRSDFVGLADSTHLYTAAEGPMPNVAAEAIAQYARNKSKAEYGRTLHDEVTAACRIAIGNLLGAKPKDIALLGSASDALSAVAGVLPFAPGDNVVVNDLEFLSVALPWMRLRAEGLEVRVVPHQNWKLPAESILAAVDERTVLVAISHVSFVNGWRSDIERLSDQLRRRQVQFLVDVTQSVGIFPIDASIADFVVSSTYKWLLGTHGLGILVVSPSARIKDDPAAIGWYSIEDASADDRYERYDLKPGAGRFEAGYLNFSAIYALNASLGYLEQVPMADRVAHVQALGDEVIDGLDRLGVDMITPRDRTERGASITFLHAEASRIGDALAAHGVHVWAGAGRVRASPNIFTCSDDVARYLAVLAECLQQSEVMAG